MKINELIQQKRKAKNLTQQELADILFLSPKTISKWETGRGLPESSIMPDIAEALDIPPAELIGSVSDTNKENTGIDPGIKNAIIISISLLLIAITLTIIGYSHVRNYSTEIRYDEPNYFYIAIILLLLSIVSYFVFENIRVIKIGVKRYDTYTNRKRYINIWFITYSIFPVYFFFTQPIRVYPQFFIHLGCYTLLPLLIYFIVRKILLKKR